MKFKWTQWTGMLLMLSLLAVFGGCSKAPADDAISSAIKASYFSDPQLRTEPITVAVNNGEVTLTGDVTTDAARLQAYKVANETPGVRKITDQLQVKPAIAAVQPEQAPPPPEPEPPKPLPPGKTPAAKTPAPETPPPPPPAPAESRPAAAKPAEPKPPPPPPPPPPPRVVSIPTGTLVDIQMIDSIDSSKNKAGEKFLATVATPIRVNDETIVPKGADIYVALAEAKSAGKMKGQSELQVELDHLELQGKSYRMRSSIVQQTGKSRGKETAKRVGIGAAIGAGIGAIAGGGKGAAIGAGVGAGSGAAVQIFTKGKQVVIPSETKLGFELQEPVEITLAPPKAKK
jgi:BON domain/YMGG-like Gly-zipper